MEIKKVSCSSLPQVGVEGLLLILFPVPFMAAAMMAGNASPPLWRMAAAGVASAACLATAFLLLRRSGLGRFFGALTLAGSMVTIIPLWGSNPIIVYLGAVIIIGAGFSLMDFREGVHDRPPGRSADNSLQRARWAAMTLAGLVVAVVIFDRERHVQVKMALTVSTGMLMLLLMHWIWRRFSLVHALALIAVNAAVTVAVIQAFMNGLSRIAAFIIAVLTILVLPVSIQAQDDRWWKVLLVHPARVLLITFFGLCTMGTLLLVLPWATPRMAFP